MERSAPAQPPAQPWYGPGHGGVYPAGRLDRDSEGLLILTDDGRQQARISSPKFKVEKTYLAQVEGAEDPAALDALLIRPGAVSAAGKPALSAPPSTVQAWSRPEDKSSSTS